MVDCPGSGVGGSASREKFDLTSSRAFFACSGVGRVRTVMDERNGLTPAPGLTSTAMDMVSVFSGFVATVYVERPTPDALAIGEPSRSHVYTACAASKFAPITLITIASPAIAAGGVAIGEGVDDRNESNTHGCHIDDLRVLSERSRPALERRK